MAHLVNSIPLGWVIQLCLWTNYDPGELAVGSQPCFVLDGLILRVTGEMTAPLNIILWRRLFGCHCVCCSPGVLCDCNLSRNEACANTIYRQADTGRCTIGKGMSVLERTGFAVFIAIVSARIASGSRAVHE
jgi:hypothetical protein